MSYGELLPEPTSMETARDVIAGMPKAFDAEAAGDLTATIQYHVVDEPPGDYYVTIENGICKAYAGVHPDPTATIRTPANVWLRIVRGELDGGTAFMTQQFTATGDMGLLMKMASLFRPAKKD